MLHRRTLILGLLAVSATGCVSRAAYQEKVDELERTKAQLRQVSEIAQKYGSEVDDLEKKSEELRRAKSELEKQNQALSSQLVKLREELEKKAQVAANMGPVDIVPTATGYAYRIAGDFLFDPGKADLKPSAKRQLADIAEQLLRHNYRIEIAGHTDSDPVRVTKKLYPRGNIELGAERALSVWQELVRLKVPEERLFISSYGPWDPVDPNDKAKNRRVEIRVIQVAPTQE